MYPRGAVPAGYARGGRGVGECSGRQPQTRLAERPEVRTSMASLRDRCPECMRRLVTTRFDATFRLPDRTERLCFGIPGGLCEDCHQLYIDPELIEMLDLAKGRCVFAIESDLVLQEHAWSSAD